MLIRVPGMLQQVTPLVCYSVLREDVAAFFGFLFKADNRKFMVPFVCVFYEMHVFRGVRNS